MDELDLAAAIEHLVDELRAKARALTRRGAVIGVSGGVDSAVCAALAVRAFPVDRVRLLHLPDQDTGPDSTKLAEKLATSLGCDLRTQDITAALRGLDVYDELAARVASVLERPGADITGWKLVRTDPVASLPVRWKVAATLADGSSVVSAALRPGDLAYIVARQNQKQQMRASVLYRAADEEHLLVVGTSNRVEIRTGFFVRHGDGAGDHFPLRLLFKSEVRSLATELGIDPAIAARPATTDTFSAAQTQREFYFGVDEEPFDHILDGFERGRPAADVAIAAGVGEDVVAAVYADLTRRQPFLRYLLSYALTEDL